jgi:hypothetical protein
MTPADEQFSLLAEVSVSEYKPEDADTVVQRTIEGMVACDLLTPEQVEHKIISTHLMQVPYSYPVPTLRRDTALSVIQPWLAERHIFSRPLRRLAVRDRQHGPRSDDGCRARGLPRFRYPGAHVGPAARRRSPSRHRLSCPDRRAVRVGLPGGAGEALTWPAAIY